MNIRCIDCDAEIEMKNDAVNGEILSCHDCGMDYVVIIDGTGSQLLKELAIEGEDWGE
jgi:alpha-aminoadipate carrier protein LysW